VVYVCVFCLSCGKEGLRHKSFEAQSSFKNSVPTSKKKQRGSISKIGWLIVFREIIVVYSENHTKLNRTMCG
jgi:hypothetical protein